MLGPVYALEWQLATRRAQKYPWRWIYIGILIVEMAVLGYESLIRPYADLAIIAEGMLYLLLAQQSAAILLVTPAFASGSITDEKRRGTLDFLLTTPVTSSEIILGKWLGQATHVLHLISPGYFLIAVLSGALLEDSRRVHVCVVEQLIMIYALTSISLLASVLVRSTARAIGGVYGFLGIVVAVDWLAGVRIIGPGLWSLLAVEVSTVSEHVAGAAALGVLTASALALAVFRLRPAHEQQRNKVARALGRWWDRPPIADAPMRWKERFVGDWMSIPLWRQCPRWLKCVCLAAVVLAVSFVWLSLETFIVLGGAQLLLSGLFVAVRAAGAITGERENQTWDSLLTTHMDAYQIVRGKLWGQIDALRPFLFTYLAAALLGAFWESAWSAAWILYTWASSWVFLYYMGAVGIASSVKSTNTWRSILVTLTVGHASSLFTAAAFTTLVATFGVMTIASFTNVGAGFLINAGLAIGSVLGLAWIFAQTEEVLQSAERELRRTRHGLS